MNLTDDERTRWHLAATSVERKAIIREVRCRERVERAEQRLGDALVDSLQRFIAAREARS